MRWPLVAVGVAWALGCARAPAPAAPPTTAAALSGANATTPAASSAPAATVKGPHLVESEGQLYAVDLPAVFPRSALLYVLSEHSVPGTQQHERLALVRITEPGPPSCRVDHADSPQFNEQAWIRGGFVHRLQVAR